MTKSQITATEVSALQRARNIVWVVTREEARVERYLIEASAAAGYQTRTWDIAQGVCDITGKPGSIGGQDPVQTFDAIDEACKGGNNRCAWILRDLPVWLKDQAGAVPLRRLRNLARSIHGAPTANSQSVIILSTDANVPAELASVTTVVEWPLPDREEIGEILDVAVKSGGAKVETLTNGTREAAIDAAIGLTSDEAAACYASSLVREKKINPTLVSREKKRVVSRERVVEWYDPLPGGLDSVGGLDLLKAWLAVRRQAFSAKARKFGLPAPRGMLLVGVPGCGKSMTAKAIATAWGCPLLRVDLGALQSKFVGESQQNLRKVFAVIAAIGRCVVWIDEVEKALQGATVAGGSADGGVSADALGALLNWMQERSGEAFVVATANDVTSLPPELMRKGRFDEIFFVDVPNQVERMEVIMASLKAYGRASVLDGGAFQAVSLVTDGFTGSEVSELVPTALYTAFAEDEREITAQDLILAAKDVVPLSKTSAEKIEKLRAWAAGRARPASTQAKLSTAIPEGRGLDIG